MWKCEALGRLLPGRRWEAGAPTVGTAPTPSGAELRLSRGEAGGLAPPPLHAWPPETAPPLEKALAPGWLLCTIKRYTTKAG